MFPHSNKSQLFQELLTLQEKYAFHFPVPRCQLFFLSGLYSHIWLLHDALIVSGMHLLGKDNWEFITLMFLKLLNDKL